MVQACYTDGTRVVYGWHTDGTQMVQAWYTAMVGRHREPVHTPDAPPRGILQPEHCHIPVDIIPERPPLLGGIRQVTLRGTVHRGALTPTAGEPEPPWSDGGVGHPDRPEDALGDAFEILRVEAPEGRVGIVDGVVGEPSRAAVGVSGADGCILLPEPEDHLRE